MTVNKSEKFFSDTPQSRWLILCFLLIFAFGVRIIDLKMLPFDFHPTRQYRSVLLAHTYYLASEQSLPDWQKDVMEAQQEEIDLLEPPLFEMLVAQAYRLIGMEALWIPRLFSIIFWLGTGIFVFLIGLRLASLDVAVLSSAFFLFVPFGIRASRSFQPDVLMLMLLIGSLYLLLNYKNNLNTKMLFWGATVGGLSILVKPQGFFMLSITALALIGYRGRQNRHHLIAFLAIALVPSLLYYGNNLLSNQTFHNQIKSSFLPHLWFEVYYWQFWLKHLWRVIGFSALVGGMFGILLMPPNWTRHFIIAMWLGYVMFGLFYSYYIHTHDYYHLQFIPAVALALGYLGATILQQLVLVNQKQLWRVPIGCILLFSMFLNIGLYLNTLSETEDATPQTRVAEQIGALVDHSTRTLILAPFYGAPLKYHAELGGNAWPTIGDMRAGQLWGEQVLSADQRLELFLQNTSPEYFIITDMDEFEVQNDLKALLTTQYPIIKKSEGFIIFDLRQH